MTGAYSFKLTEEIARWAFEVHLKAYPDWMVAFCNPTAGPWKLLTCSDLQGALGEVHRFEREEERPDLVLVNDSLKIIIILEAKESIQKLADTLQLRKSAEVVGSLSTTLRNKTRNSYWAHRCDYAVAAGLLWGATGAISEDLCVSTCAKFGSFLARVDDKIANTILGVETRSRAGEGLTCLGMSVGSDRIRKGLSSGALLTALGLNDLEWR